MASTQGWREVWHICMHTIGGGKSDILGCFDLETAWLSIAPRGSINPSQNKVKMCWCEWPNSETHCVRAFLMMPTRNATNWVGEIIWDRQSPSQTISSLGEQHCSSKVLSLQRRLKALHLNFVRPALTFTMHFTSCVLSINLMLLADHNTSKAFSFFLLLYNCCRKTYMPPATKILMSFLFLR